MSSVPTQSMVNYSYRKGETRELDYKAHYERLGYQVVYKGVRANGVDLICYKKSEFLHPKDAEFGADGIPYEEHVIIFEITNWVKRNYMAFPRMMGIINNLKDEKVRQKKLHPKALVTTILVVSYSENIDKIQENKYIQQLVIANEIYFEVVGHDQEPLLEEEILA